MKKTIYYLILLFLTLSNVSCIKSKEDTEDKLPTGENTMYYYIDGELYVPKGKNIGGMYAPAIGFGRCLDDSFDFVTLNLLLHFHNGIQQTGKVTLNQSHYDACQVHDNHAFLHGQKELGNDGVWHNINYYTHDGSGTVNITYLSPDKKHFKGTFEMTVYHENTNRPIHITDGHFNINLNTLNK